LQKTALGSRNGVRAALGGKICLYLLAVIAKRFLSQTARLRKLALKLGIRHGGVNPLADDVIDKPRSRFLIKADYLPLSCRTHPALADWRLSFSGYWAHRNP
jgi:hypothetical protein